MKKDYLIKNFVVINMKQFKGSIGIDACSSNNYLTKTLEGSFKGVLTAKIIKNVCAFCRKSSVFIHDW